MLHERAREWCGANGGAGLASCPLTQNGCLRIMSHSGYQNPLPVAEIAARPRNAVAGPHHEFWPDDISLLDERVADATRIHGHRQITDLYLLALAVRHDGTFVTFDGAIAVNAVHGAAKRHLTML